MQAGLGWAWPGWGLRTWSSVFSALFSQYSLSQVKMVDKNCLFFFLSFFPLVRRVQLLRYYTTKEQTDILVIFLNNGDPLFGWRRGEWEPRCPQVLSQFAVGGEDRIVQGHQSPEDTQNLWVLKKQLSKLVAEGSSSPACGLHWPWEYRAEGWQMSDSASRAASL